jgi:hypothetical protein
MNGMVTRIRSKRRIYSVCGEWELASSALRINFDAVRVALHQPDMRFWLSCAKTRIGSRPARMGTMRFGLFLNLPASSYGRQSNARAYGSNKALNSDVVSVSNLVYPMLGNLQGRLHLKRDRLGLRLLVYG